MLRRRDIELIGALVEGTLADETRARALIEQSEEARREYEAQRTSYLALQSAQHLEMSDTERAALHRDLWSELQSAPAAKTRSVPWYYRLAPVAAALIVVVGVLAVLDQGAQQAASGDSFSDIAGGLTSGTTAAAGGLESADDGAAAPSAEGDGSSRTLEEAVPQLMTRNEFFASIAEMVRSGDFTTTTQLLPDQTGQVDQSEACEGSSEVDGLEILGEATNLELKDDQELSTKYLIAVPTGRPIESDTVVTFISAETCQVVHSEG